MVKKDCEYKQARSSAAYTAYDCTHPLNIGIECNINLCLHKDGILKGIDECISRLENANSGSDMKPAYEELLKFKKEYIGILAKAGHIKESE